MTGLGKYCVEQELGRGAAGITYLARDTTNQRRVALKVLVVPHTLTGDDLTAYVERFLREARSAGAIQHPGVPRIYEAGVADDQYFIAMEYCEGVTLRRLLLDRGPLTPERAFVYIRQLLEVLVAAHALGIFHRDIKPDNIIVSPDETHLKLTDFGIARVLGDATITRTGAPIGTPSYMSPEQAMGREIDARSDLFSVGILLHELLTAKKPFAGSSLPELLHAISYNEPEIDPALPHDLALIIDRSLVKRPAGRFQDAAKMLAALDAYQQGGWTPDPLPPDPVAPDPAVDPPLLQTIVVAAGAAVRTAAGWDWNLLKRKEMLQLATAAVGMLGACTLLLLAWLGSGSRAPVGAKTEAPGVAAPAAQSPVAPQVAGVPQAPSRWFAPAGRSWSMPPQQPFRSAYPAAGAKGAAARAKPIRMTKLPPLGGQSGLPPAGALGSMRFGDDPGPGATLGSAKLTSAPAPTLPDSGSGAALTNPSPGPESNPRPQTAAPQPAAAPSTQGTRPAEPARKPVVNYQRAANETPSSTEAHPSRSSSGASVSSTPQRPGAGYSKVTMISADYALHWGIRTGKPIPNPAHYGYWYKTITPVEAYRRHGLHVLNPIPDPALYGPPPVPLSKIPLPPDLAELR